MKSRKYFKLVVALVAIVVMGVSCTKMEADSTKKTGIVNPTKVVK